MKKPEDTPADVPTKALPGGVLQPKTQVVSEEAKCGSTSMDKLERLAEARGDAEILEVVKGHRRWLEG